MCRSVIDSDYNICLKVYKQITFNVLIHKIGCLIKYSYKTLYFHNCFISKMPIDLTSNLALFTIVLFPHRLKFRSRLYNINCSIIFLIMI